MISHYLRVVNELTQPLHKNPLAQSSETGPSKFSSERVAHNVVMRMKDVDKNFDSDLGECRSEFVDSYEQITNDNNLPMEKKLQYLNKILSEDVLRYYRFSSDLRNYLQTSSFYDRQGI